MVSIKMKVINEFGTFESSIIDMDDEVYPEFVEMSKLFWITDTSFSLDTDDGVIVFPPEIISKSILKIEKT
jgi:hypothetical protein